MALELENVEAAMAKNDQTWEEVQAQMQKDPDLHLDPEELVESLPNWAWDYVMVMPYPSADDADKAQNATNKRKEILTNLIQHGVVIKTGLSQDKDEVFALLSLSQEKLEKYAEKMKLELPLKQEFGGGYAEYTVAQRHVFKDNAFTTLKRQQIVDYVVQRHAQVNINDEIREENICKYYPLHDQQSVDDLTQKWIKNKNPLFVPVDRIRAYFGEKVALYFGFLDHYNRWLVTPAFLGIAITVIRFFFGYKIGGGRLHRDYLYWEAGFAMFLMLWATFFAMMWKRRNAVLAFRWNMMNYEEQESARAEFKGKPMCGIYSKGGFIPLNPEQYKNQIELYSPDSTRRLKYLMGTPVFGLIVGVAVIGTITLMYYKSIAGFFKMFAGPLNAILIVVLNLIYDIIATKMNDWENHRTPTQYEDSLILKKFFFQAINSYMSLFYIAFWKGTGAPVFGFQQPDCLSGDCVWELEYQMAFIFLIPIFIGHFQELLLPIIKRKLLLWWEARKARNMAEKEGTAGEEPQPINRFEEQAKFEEYPGVIDEYNEMIIQFGYILLFGTVFPLAPLFALINNLIECKTDGLKFLTAHQRPSYHGAQDLGPWEFFIDFVRIAGVLTNCFMLHFTAKKLDANGQAQPFWSFQLAVIVEHSILGAALVLSYMIPQVPASVEKAITLQEFHKKELQGDDDHAPDREIQYADNFEDIQLD